ncbi:hypothetical protein TELCIR_24401 [Teladorsagia circumcincta]|uniref:Uncharacterized protein n=1 Tax=Teladorsagia circumcincta TaxID=45464 RepID=A0A2G9T8F3_TELCI|nr:hypothetical protein TELCIR_24401 [Teladorsagia circumcincta]
MCGKSAPLYNGYYPVCDPDDPGHACCGKVRLMTESRPESGLSSIIQGLHGCKAENIFQFGYCGSGAEFCGCPECVDYAADPMLILKEPIKPSQSKITW